METEELADFSDPSAYGVPYAHASDLADPEIWRAWVCAKVTAPRAREQKARENKRREWEEQQRIAALRRRTPLYEAGDPFSWGQSLGSRSPWGAVSSDDTDPLGWLRRALHSPEHADWMGRTSRSLATRLTDGTLRAFARPEKARAPWVWVRPQEWADTKPRGDRSRPGAIILSGSTYWQMHIFDPVGLPLDQAAVACRARTAANVELARASIGRRLLDETYRDQKGENVIRELREALAAKLRAGRLVAIRGGTALVPEDFAPGAPLGNVNAWDGNSDVLVRAPAPPRREAPEAPPEDWRKEELRTWEREETWLQGWRPNEERFLLVLTTMGALAPPFLKDGLKMEFKLSANKLIQRALKHLSTTGNPVKEVESTRPWKVVEDKWNSKKEEANRKHKIRRL